MKEKLIDVVKNNMNIRKERLIKYLDDEAAETAKEIEYIKTNLIQLFNSDENSKFQYMNDNPEDGDQSYDYKIRQFMTTKVTDPKLIEYIHKHCESSSTSCSDFMQKMLNEVSEMFGISIDMEIRFNTDKTSILVFIIFVYYIDDEEE
ncbi:MAG: hypothetical protein ACRC5M_04805 [Anaeroplasmataceae bacterium]